MSRFAALAAVALLGAPSHADPCSCTVDMRPCAAVFGGTTFVGVALSTSDDEGYAQTTFLVTDALLSPPLGPVVRISHMREGILCGTGFEPGQLYFVAAERPEPGLELSTDLCSPTHRVEDIETDPHIQFAHHLPARTRARVRGIVYDGSSFRAGIKLRIAGLRRPVTSDRRGRFEVQLPVGTHAIEVASPGVELERSPQSVRVLHPAHCAFATVIVKRR